MTDRAIKARGLQLRRRAAKVGLSLSKAAGGGDLWRLKDASGRAVIAGPLSRCEAFVAEQSALMSV